MWELELLQCVEAVMLCVVKVEGTVDLNQKHLEHETALVGNILL